MIGNRTFRCVSVCWKWSLYSTHAVCGDMQTEKGEKRAQRTQMQTIYANVTITILSWSVSRGLSQWILFGRRTFVWVCLYVMYRHRINDGDSHGGGGGGGGCVGGSFASSLGSVSIVACHAPLCYHSILSNGLLNFNHIWFPHVSNTC